MYYESQIMILKCLFLSASNEHLRLILCTMSKSIQLFPANIYGHAVTTAKFKKICTKHLSLSVSTEDVRKFVPVSWYGILLIISFFIKYFTKIF